MKLKYDNKGFISLCVKCKKTIWKALSIIFPVYTREACLIVLIFASLFFVQIQRSNNPVVIQNIEKKEHYQTEESEIVYIDSELFELDDYPFQVDVNSKTPTDEEVSNYLQKVNDDYQKYLKNFFTNSINEMFYYDGSFYGCDLSVDFTKSSGFNDHNLINIDNRDKDHKDHKVFQVYIHYVLSYANQQIESSFNTTFPNTLITNEYKQIYLEKLLEFQLNTELKIDNKDFVDLPELYDFKYYNSEKPMGIIEFFRIMFIMISIASLLLHLERKEINSRIQRQKRIQLIYFINNFVLMFQTGLTIPRSFRIATKNRLNTINQKNPSFPIFQKVNNLLEQDISIYEIVKYFDYSFNIVESNRFCRLVLQNLNQGDHFLSDQLTKLSEKMWEERIRNARKVSEKASSKLIFPMLIIFVVIIIITIVPTFLEVNKI